MQDMSYEALTNLEDVKLTAPPELLATMPLDMCLKVPAALCVVLAPLFLVVRTFT